MSNTPKKRAARKDLTPVKKTPEIPVVSFFGNPEHMEEILQEDLDLISKSFGVKIHQDRNKYFVSSHNLENCRKAVICLEKMYAFLDKTGDIDEDDVQAIVDSLIFKPYPKTKYNRLYTTFDGVDISPRTENHDAIVQTIKTNTITVLHGCAGSGKSLFSLIMGLKYLKDNRFDKIILLRPMSTVGKSLGYLPGDLSEKYMPYASPLSSALVELIGEKEYENLINTKKLCFEPIALTRGANFKNAYIILDEAQNTSKTEILTLLTRICYNTKFVITGDTSQDDRVINRATPAEKSGLEYVIERLSDNDEVGFVKMVKADIQRNKIVGDIIDAFE